MRSAIRFMLLLKGTVVIPPCLLYSWRFSHYSVPFHWLVHGHMTSNNETVSRQMPWAGNIAKTMTSNGKQFTVTREMLTAVAGISARFSKFAFVLFCYITNHLMTGPLGNSEFCFPRISMFPSTSSRETLRFSGNKIHCSPRDQSLSVKCGRDRMSYPPWFHGVKVIVDLSQDWILAVHWPMLSGQL